MKNVFTQYIQQTIDNLKDSRKDIKNVFTDMQNDVNKWANIPSISQTPNATTAANNTTSNQNNASVHIPEP